MKRGFTPDVHLQFWDSKPPTKRDTLCVLMKALEVLCEALPMALRHVGSEPIENQEKLWRAFMAFDLDTDLAWAATEEGKDFITGIGEVLEQWRETVECRVHEPLGDLTKSDAPEVPA